MRYKMLILLCVFFILSGCNEDKTEIVEILENDIDILEKESKILKDKLKQLEMEEKELVKDEKLLLEEKAKASETIETLHKDIKELE